jgi:hypothetical protein
LSVTVNAKAVEAPYIRTDSLPAASVNSDRACPEFYEIDPRPDEVPVRKFAIIIAASATLAACDTPGNHYVPQYTTPPIYAARPVYVPVPVYRGYATTSDIGDRLDDVEDRLDDLELQQMMRDDD